MTSIEIPRRRKMSGAAFDNASICIARVGLDLRVLEVNECFARQFGRAGDDPVGLGLFDFVHPMARSRFRHRLWRLASGDTSQFTERILAAGQGGSTTGGDLTVAAVTDPAGRVEALLVLVRPDHGLPEAEAGVAEVSGLCELDARILEGLAEGDSTARLAAKVYLSVSAVEYRVASLTRRFNVKKRAALVSKGYALGILEAGYWPPRAVQAHTANKTRRAS